VSDPAGHIRRYVHALNGQLRALELPDGAHHHWSYSKAGALLGYCDPYGRQTQWQRNLRGQLLQRTDAQQRSITQSYDAAQRLHKLINENGEAFEFIYDEADRIIEERRVGGTRVSLQYNANGWPIAVTYHPRDDHDSEQAQAPRRIELIRDAAGRLVQKRTARHHYHYRYDDADQLIEASKLAVIFLDEEDLQENPSLPEYQLKPLHTTRFEYDKTGNLVKESSINKLTGEEHSLSHSHDELGNRTRSILPELPKGHPQAGKSRALNYLYYGSGHLHQINFSQHEQAEHAQAIHQLICDIERDALHQETYRSQGNLHTRFSYDPVGRLTSAWSRSATLDNPLFDSSSAQGSDLQKALGGLQAAAPIEQKELTGLLKAWQYDKVGELLLTRHSLQGARGYQYDATGRIEQTQRARLPGSTGSLLLAANEAFHYDPAGNLQDSTTLQQLSQRTQHKQSGYIKDNLVRVFEDKRFYYDGHERLIKKLSGKHTAQRFEWDEENRLTAVHTTRRPGTQHESCQSTYFNYDALGRRVSKSDDFGTTQFIWEGMRLIEERRGTQIVTYVYEPDSYVPLARLDALAEQTEQGGLGTTADPTHKAEQPKQPTQTTPANDAEARYWASLDDTAQANGTEHRAAAVKTGTGLCNVYYFHTDQVGMPEELSNSQGQLCWQASYRTWGATVAEQWEVRTLAGQRAMQEGDKPQTEQNLRLQGQYLDRSTGLHYNTFRYYDPDIGRFISPDPIGLQGGINLHSYAPNPSSWIDPWGWACSREQLARNRQNGKAWESAVTSTAQGKYGAANVESQVRIQPLDAQGNPTGGVVIADNVIYGANGAPIKIIDAKASSTAPFTTNQRVGYPNINNNGGIILNGPNAGTKIPAGTRTVDVRPGGLGKI
jgi:RHS repeat-associated protein